MYRTRGKVLGVALAVAASGVLVACGDNDSTASKTPTLSSSASATQQPSATTEAAPAPQGEEAQPQQPAPPAPPAEEEQPERPAPVPPPDTAEQGADLGENEQKFIDELNKQGVTPSSPDIALSIGNYVCQGIAQGASDEQMTTFVTAMAGSDPAFDPAKMPVEQAGQIYISTAKQHYCQ
ncbi:DUF732 domain-containing protein [Nocardia donostiensis]|uniref:DUF732 domain-containing protein n=1 Tax=Nocardia donostiensis TaxID=1538463 RepID=A0A1W0AVH4_9NOCA|nr:DUF732 domain-containing protein [Nocardia donostiensis]ONM46014.1 hypothetical protein B0T46_25250 [Nocardia donostiensis]OQS14218.1 hypothetical protein B0T36_14390 [Nocardia donostiensis]OQS18466.1 hypothetical protein B0T44_19360 [Nocardia donostiensis]